MTEPADTSRWCPSCGDEYVPTAETCVDCSVPLVDDEPHELHPVAQHIETKQDESELAVSFDLSELDERQRGELIVHLESNPLPHGWLDEHTIAAFAGYENELRAVVDSVRGGGRPGRAGSAARIAGRPASLLGRALARGLDISLFLAVVFIAGRLLERGQAFALAVGLSLIGSVLGVRERARSVGKASVGIVVRRRNGDPLSIGEAFMRSMSIDAPLAVGIFGFWSAIADGDTSWLLPGLGIAIVAAVAASVLSDTNHRGVHDLVVDSAVYRRGTVGHTDEYVSDVQIIS